MNDTKTLISQIFLHARNFPAKTAIIYQDEFFTYQQLKAKITDIANIFLQSGIKKSDRILLSASRSPSFIFSYFAAHLIGAVAVPIDPNLPKTRVKYIIEKASPKAVFLTDQIDKLILTKPGKNKKINFPNPDQVADILFTSGTTQDPKGVILTHKNIYAAARNINQFLGNDSSDSEIVPLPLSHSFGLGRIRCNFLTGGTIILCNGFLNPLKILTLMKQHKATGFSSVPAGFAILLKLTKDQLGQFRNNLKYIELGSAPMSTEDKKALIKIFPKTRICMHYGLTEASRSLFIEFYTDSRKLGSIGKPAPNVKIKIVDEAGKKTPQGEIGQLMIKGDTIMKGYLNDKNSTRKILKKGWLLTEDLAYIDNEGYYFLAGRKSDLVNIGGEKVNPLEIETILNKNQAISESACIGIEDPKKITGQIVKAFLVLKKGKRKPQNAWLVNFLRQYLEEYKIPREFEWIKNIPKTSSGKIQRRLLK